LDHDVINCALRCALRRKTQLQLKAAAYIWLGVATSNFCEARAVED